MIKLSQARTGGQESTSIYTIECSIDQKLITICFKTINDPEDRPCFLKLEIDGEGIEYLQTLYASLGICDQQEINNL